MPGLASLFIVDRCIPTESESEPEKHVPGVTPT
jgi:hypothetical protein